MGMGAGQAAGIAPDVGKAKPAMLSVFGLIDLVRAAHILDFLLKSAKIIIQYSWDERPWVLDGAFVMDFHQYLCFSTDFGCLKIMAAAKK